MGDVSRTDDQRDHSRHDDRHDDRTDDENPKAADGSLKKQPPAKTEYEPERPGYDIDVETDVPSYQGAPEAAK